MICPCDHMTDGSESIGLQHCDSQQHSSQPFTPAIACKLHADCKFFSRTLFAVDACFVHLCRLLSLLADCKAGMLAVDRVVVEWFHMVYANCMLPRHSKHRTILHF